MKLAAFNAVAASIPEVLHSRYLTVEAETRNYFDQVLGIGEVILQRYPDGSFDVGFTASGFARWEFKAQDFIIASSRTDVISHGHW